jgi:serine/threonine protein kinase/tetratricopeptide (TPR) repeat protein
MGEMASAPQPSGSDPHATFGRADLAMQLALRSVMSGVLGRSHEIQLGRYRVRERLGHGGCGLVLLAEDPELDREVAIKVVLPTRGADTSRAKWQEALQREARAIARLRHPNVVEVFDAGTTELYDEDTGEQQVGVYLVMERLRGRTLRQWLAKQPRSWREIVDVHVQAARGLMAAHGAGIVHRDFKPDNVLLTSDGRVVLIDFGLADEARELEESSSLDLSDSQHGDMSVTRKSRVVGTPLYMAPEQHLGRDVGPAADQYAWCVSLFQALYGRAPFGGDSMDEIVAHKFSGKLPKARSGPPRALHRVLARGLRVEPRERHADLDALVRATVRASAGAKRFVPAIAAGTIAGAAAAAALVLGRPLHPCDDAPLSWSTSWSEDQRTQVATGLGGIAVADASAIATRVLDQIDRHGRRWQSAYDQVCGREGAGPHVVAQLECLERGLEQIEHVEGALAGLTADNLGQASPLLDGLRPPSECLVVESAGHRSEAERAEIAELWRRMDQVNVEVDATGQLSDPEWTKAALERADELGDAALASTIAWRLGQVARAAGRLEEGADYMHTAVFRAAAAHDHQRALRLMPLLILAVGSDLGRRDEAESLFEHAKVMGEQLDDAREQIADAETSLAYIAIEAGEKERALDIYRRALVTFEAMPEPPRQLPRVRLALAGAEIEAGDYDKAAAMLASAREDLDHLSLPTDLNYATIDYLEGGIAGKRGDYDGAERGFGNAVAQLRIRLHGHPFVGVGLCGLASAQIDVGLLEEAEASIQEARSLALAAYGPQHADTVRYELVFADVSWRRQRFDESVAAIERALDALERLPDREAEFLVDAQLLGAWSAWATGDLAKAERWAVAMHSARNGENTSNVDFPRSLRRLDALLTFARGDVEGARKALQRPVVTSVSEPLHDPELERRLDAFVLATIDGTARPDAKNLERPRQSYFTAFARGTDAALRTRDAAVLPAATAKPR